MDFLKASIAASKAALAAKRKNTTNQDDEDEGINKYKKRKDLVNQNNSTSKTNNTNSNKSSNDINNNNSNNSNSNQEYDDEGNPILSLSPPKKNVSNNNNPPSLSLNNSNNTNNNNNNNEAPAPVDPISLLSIAEVKKRLRMYGHPITLFGESAENRMNRLKTVELANRERAEGSSEGRKNILHEILENEVLNEINAALMEESEKKISEHQKRETQGDNDDKDNKDNNNQQNNNNDPNNSDDNQDNKKQNKDKDNSDDDDSEDDSNKTALEKKFFKPSKAKKNIKDIVKSNFVAVEDYVLSFFKHLLFIWEEALAARPLSVKKSPFGKQDSATQKQTRLFLKPLFKVLKGRIAAPDILAHCINIVDACLKGDYVLANEHYLTMAIGNDPWPMGVTMVGIHERAGREKLFSDKVAHVLNDETQRKYVQSIKRLITYCAERYPSTSNWTEGSIVQKLQEHITANQ